MISRISDALSLLPEDSSGDSRLLSAVEEYQKLLEQGQRPDKSEFVRRYPDLALALPACLDGLELVHRAAAGESKSAVVEPPITGAPLGDFQIVREIGRGGMGIIYEAIQLSLGRRVALKVLPFASAFDAKTLQRFRNEAQAAAQLHHTNIVPVYAVGCERGVHYYAMQLIDGNSLAAVVRQLRREAGYLVDLSQHEAASVRPNDAASPALPAPPTMAPIETAKGTASLSTHRSERRDRFFRTAAQMIAQAADGLEHAHQVGIVHRDVKPANLILDANGTLWVADFGLALFHSEVGLTRTGDLLGTLRYMSPEQASGQRTTIDHRTDVYSLGATLYELITLEPMFPGQSHADLLRQILDQEPKSPRAWDRNIPVELETVLLKAVSKSPADRYVSSKAFADDLRRFLDDKPIQARRPSLMDRARKWSRRHPSAVIATMVVLVFLVAGLIVSNWVISEEQRKTKDALSREKDRAKEAELRFAQARKAVDLLVETSEEELGDSPWLQGARRRLLETALTYYQAFIDERKSDPSAQADLAQSQARVRKILDELTALQGALKHILVMNGEVQRELNLSGDQRADLKLLDEQWAKQRLELFKDASKVDAKVRRQRFAEAIRGADTALDSMLDPGQRSRLQQIFLQLQGPFAFQTSYVVAALELTPDQQKRIRDLDEKMFIEMKPGPPSFGPFDRKKDVHISMQATVEKILKTLSSTQRTRWNELVGEKFEARIRMPAMLFIGGPPGPPGPPLHGPPPDGRR
ncbi:MAG: serine/threonine protein kinase [Gemmataceae bacterium]|nr:serine/threonine protein kinase [Gemmataceae bacterium]